MQVIFALPAVGETDLTMRIYNSDGSEPEMCGNGIRCLARFVADVDGAAARKYKIHTLAGIYNVLLGCCRRCWIDQPRQCSHSSRVRSAAALSR